VETAWTVQATNPTTTAMVYEISATCVKGIPITNGVWFAPFAQKGSQRERQLHFTDVS
jgi:hypothetical protein